MQQGLRHVVRLAVVPNQIQVCCKLVDGTVLADLLLKVGVIDEGKTITLQVDVVSGERF